MKVSVAMGDGIGPEIMGAVLDVFTKANVPLEYEMVEMGKVVALAGEQTGISAPARRSVESTGILFKGPMETPKGGGYKSVNVTARKLWGTFANKRVYRTLPGVPTPLGTQQLNLTMVRENIEDTYGAIEHMQTHDVAQCRRLITRPGCEQVHRYTFEMASRKGARRVTCGHKANIMKLTDGLFLETFYDVAKNYPDLEADDVIIDAMAMRLVVDPTEFDVVVMPNLQGDILTDLAAGLVGGLAYAPSANIGDGICIFEAVHGTAPDIAGQDLANPSALLLSGTMMLRHVGLVRHASVIETALERTLVDLHRRPNLDDPVRILRTSTFLDRILDEIDALSLPDDQPTPMHKVARQEPRMRVSRAPQETRLRGVDVFLESAEAPESVASKLGDLVPGLEVTMISNRGTQVWPSASPYTDCINHYRVRFESHEAAEQTALVGVLAAAAHHYTLCGAEWLREIDGRIGFSLAQGQS
ncbi:MAG: isocitrate/isopropylmalate family dehydrogenase [Myxococcota bacterium]